MSTSLLVERLQAHLLDSKVNSFTMDPMNPNCT